MTKTELIAEVAERTGLSKKTIAEIIGHTVTTITDELARGGSVSFIGFGSFGVRKREARTCYDPRTREAIKVAAKTVPFFKAGSVLKQTIANSFAPKSAKKKKK